MFNVARIGAVAALLVCCGAALAQPQDPANLVIRRSSATGMATFITPLADPAAKPGERAVISVKTPAGRSRLVGPAFWDQYGGLFGITDPGSQLLTLKVEVDNLGYVHTGFQQMHKGVPVFSGVLRLHQNANGQVVGANGDFYPIKDSLAVVPSITAAGAEAAARKSLDIPCRPIVEASELCIVDPGWYGDASIGARLAYRVVLTDLEANVRESFFIDAHTAEVLDRWSLIEQLLNRQVYDGQGGTSLPGVLTRAEGAPAIGNADLDAAYDYAGDFYRYLQRGFGRDSIDSAGFALTITVNSTAATCPNAFFNGFQAAFCSGVVTDDVVAHELAHGLTGFTAGLIYQNQSGQLNESFSDVFGELVDMFNGNVSAIGAPGGTPWPSPPPSGPGVDTPNNLRTVCSPRPSHPDGVRWLVGEDSSAFGGAIRDMFDPTCRNHPDRANSQFQTCSANDSGGVHSGSGVPNHAFMLTTDGGTFNTRTITGIGLIKSGAVWYRALTVYLTPSSDFKDSFDAFNQAAADLVGTTITDPRTGLPGPTFTVSDAAQVTEALLAVEMNTDGACGQTSNVLDEAPPRECANPSVIFADSFETANPGWTVANSNPPTPYDWARTTSSLPFLRPGVAFFCEDRAVGDCNTIDESATHTLTSPAIAIPISAAFPFLAFTHSLGSEGRFDGGVVQININNAGWNDIPRERYVFNPPNGQLKPASIGNTNPLVSGGARTAFTGSGGRWGRTLIDLRPLGIAGNSVQIRFAFGKDGCTGGQGWYVDDFAIYNCPDCDANAVADVNQFVSRTATAFQGPIGTGANLTFNLASLPAPSGAVILEALAAADLSAGVEYVDVEINGTVVGRLFETGGTDCPATSNRQSLSVPQATWQSLVTAGTANIRLIGTADMNPAVCDGTYMGLHISYPLAAADTDNDGILNACETCPADFNQSGTVTVQDIFDFLGAYFVSSPAADFNQSGAVTVQDIFDFLGAYFTTCP